MTDNNPTANLLAYSLEGNLAGIKEALSQGADINAVLSEESTPPIPWKQPRSRATTRLFWDVSALECAVLSKNDDAVEYLINNGANVNHRDRYETTALHLAAAQGYAGMTQMLLDAGADASADSRDDHRPCDVALLNGFHYLAELLRRESEERSAPNLPSH